MAAGTKYNIKPEYKPEEIYRVETGVRKSGPWKLDTTNLPEGATLPVFTPVCADPETRTIIPIRNFKIKHAEPVIDEEGNPVINEEGFPTISVCVGDNPLAYVGLELADEDGHIGVVKKVEKVSGDYWLQLDGEINPARMLADVTELSANFVLYDPKKVELDAPVLCTLLMQAYEVKESKLCIPLRDADKVTLTSRFQFE